MRVLVLGSQDTVWGFALAGVHGQIVTTPEEVERALDAALADKEIGILLITDDVAGMARQRVDRLIARSMVPLVVEIPGPGGPAPDRPALGDVLRQTLGVKL